MFPAPQMTDEEFREVARDLEDYLRSLLRKETAALILGGKVLGVAALIGIVVGALVAAGQIAALGLYPALTTYRFWWLSSPFIGAATPIAFYLVGLLFFVGSERVEKAYVATFSEQARKVLGRAGMVLLVALFVGMIVGLPMLIGFQEARKSNRVLADSELSTLPTTRDAIDEQVNAFQEFSASGKALVRSLDDMRATLSETLQTAESQLVASRQASANVSRLVERQHQIELRTAELERLLEGAKPITRQDLETSSRTGLLVGALLGFVASLAASAAYAAQGRFLRKRDKEAG